MSICLKDSVKLLFLIESESLTNLSSYFSDGYNYL